MDMPQKSHHYYYCVLAAAYIVFFAFLFYPWNGGGWDTVFYYSYLSSLFFDGDIDILNDLALSHHTPDLLRDFCAMIGPKGITANQGAMGTAILWLPFYLLVRAVGWALQLFSTSPPLWTGDRFSCPYLMAISLATLSYGFLTLVLIYATCALEHRPAIAVCGTLGAVFGSPLLPYIFHQSAMSHTQSAFAVSLLLYLSIRHRQYLHINSYLLVGAVVGLATLVRWQNIVFGLIPAVFWLQCMIRRRERAQPIRADLLHAGVAIAVSLAVFSIQSFYWFAQMGSWFVIPRGVGGIHWWPPNIFNVFLSGCHGLYYWHPLLLVATCGLVVYACGRKHRTLGFTLIFCVLLMAYVNGATLHWWAGRSFGQRRFCGTIPLFGLALAAFYSLFPLRFTVVPVVMTVITIVLNVLLELAFNREITDLVFSQEIGMLRKDLVMTVGEWIRTLHLDSLVCVYLFLGGKYLKGILLLLGGISLIAGLLALLLKKVFLSLENNARSIILLFLAVVVCLDVILLLRAPATDLNGIAFSRVLSPQSTLSLDEKRGIVRQLVQAKYPNPLLYFYAVETLGERSSLPDYLRAVYEIGPHVWVTWIDRLPPSDVPNDVRQLAEQSRRKLFLSVFSFYWERICQEYNARTGKELRWYKSILRHNPFHVVFLRRAADQALADGDKKQAKEFRGRLRRYLEARVVSFFANEDRLIPYQASVFRTLYRDLSLELGRVYEESNQLYGARLVYENIARLCPDSRVAHQRKLLLAAQANGGRLDDNALLGALDTFDTPAETYIETAKLCNSRGNLKLAVRVFQTGLKHHPNDPSLGYWLGTILNGCDVSEIPFSDLMALEMESLEYWFVVGGTLNRAGRFADAARGMETVKAQLVQKPWACFIYAIALFHTQRFSDAEPYFRRAVESSPESAVFASFLARCLLEQGKDDAASKVLDDAISHHPDDKDLSFWKSVVESRRH